MYWLNLHSLILFPTPGALAPLFTYRRLDSKSGIFSLFNCSWDSNLIFLASCLFIVGELCVCVCVYACTRAGVRVIIFTVKVRGLPPGACEFMSMDKLGYTFLGYSL